MSLFINIRMKILIYSQQRTRSSFLLDVLCQNYNLKNYFEPYSDLLNPSYHKCFDRSPNNVFKRYIENGKELTEKLKNSDNFGVKLFAVCSYNYYKFAGTTARNPKDLDIKLEKNDLVNIIENYNLDMYDKIFVLSRDETQRLASNLHAEYHDNFLFHKNMKGWLELCDTENKSLPKFEDWKIKAKLLETVAFKYHVELLKRRYKNLVILDYEQVPDYVKTHYPDIESIHQETNFNYKELKKYDQLKELVEQHSKQLQVDKLLESLLSN